MSFQVGEAVGHLGAIVIGGEPGAAHSVSEFLQGCGVTDFLHGQYVWVHPRDGGGDLPRSSCQGREELDA